MKRSCTFRRKNKAAISAAYEAIPEEVGKPAALITDVGYNTAEHLEALEDKTDLYVSVHREDAHKEREYDFRLKEKQNNQSSNRSAMEDALNRELKSRNYEKLAIFE